MDPRQTGWKGIGLGLGFLSLAGIPGGIGNAQELVPAAYTVAPVGINLVSVAGAHNRGDLSFDPSLPVSDASARITGWSVTYGRTFGLLGRAANVALILPYVVGDLDGIYLGERTFVERSGLGDGVVRLGVNLVGAPALDPRAFVTFRPGTLLGASLTLRAPTGQYFPEKVINIGTNRWALKPELGLVHNVGSLALDLYLGGWFFSTNPDFAGGQEKDQDPVLSSEVHLRYFVRPGLWAAVDGNFWRGGQTTVDGVAKDDLQENSRVGLTVAWQVTRGHGLRFAASRGAITRIGGDFTSVGLSYSYTWTRRPSE